MGDGELEMEWIKDLTMQNLLALLDVALDIQEELQLGQDPCIPIVPSVVRFSQLMPADGTNMRDRYGNLRWKALQLLKQKGIINKVDIISGGHRWENEARILVENKMFSETLFALKDELSRRQNQEYKNGNIDSKSPADIEPASKEFEKITLQWLKQHLPLKIWMLLISFSIGIFSSGITAGQLEIIRQFLGTPTFIESSKVQERIDQLTEGYNKRTEEITKGIVAEERKAGEGYFAAYHVEAATRLRKLRDEEQIKFQEAVNALRGLQTSSK